MLKATLRQFKDGTELHIIDIDSFDNNLVEFVDLNIVSICEGASGTPVQLTKRNFNRFLVTKDITTQHGAVAEFFVHLYLYQLGFKQEFLFLNLEEGSIKKGFDGYFSASNEEYLVESKSGASTTVNISHRNKIKLAFKDITEVVSGTSAKSKNNPWKNAYNHASHADVGTSKTIRRKIKDISDLYDQGRFKDIALFNIIPCSTIFSDPVCKTDFSLDILNENEDFTTKFKAKSTKIICITKNTFDVFLSYLRGE
jgi:hypothetical protein